MHLFAEDIYDAERDTYTFQPQTWPRPALNATTAATCVGSMPPRSNASDMHRADVRDVEAARDVAALAKKATSIVAKKSRCCIERCVPWTGGMEESSQCDRDGRRSHGGGWVEVVILKWGPCVDGSELARVFFTGAGLVGAAMCSAFERGSRDRWP